MSLNILKSLHKYKEYLKFLGQTIYERENTNAVQNATAIYPFTHPQVGNALCQYFVLHKILTGQGM